MRTGSGQFGKMNVLVLLGPISALLASLPGRKCLPISPLPVLAHLLAPTPTSFFTSLDTACFVFQVLSDVFVQKNAWMHQDPLEALQIIQVSGEDGLPALPPTLTKGVWPHSGLPRLLERLGPPYLISHCLALCPLAAKNM